MRWFVAWALFTVLGAAVGAGVFFADQPSGAKGLIGAMFALPGFIVIGGLVGTVVGVIVGFTVRRRET